MLHKIRIHGETFVFEGEYVFSENASVKLVIEDRDLKRHVEEIIYPKSR